MRSVLLINPNTSAATTGRMVAAARALLPPGVVLRGVQAARGVPMITDEAALRDAAAEVARLGAEAAAGHDALIVAAFGDPGVARLRERLAVPVIGLGEAAVREAAQGNRRFGIATTTPRLVRTIEATVRSLGFDAGFTGVRVPGNDPVALATDPGRQAAALFEAVTACLERDGADVVVIGGGPLNDAATQLARRLRCRVVAPVPAAVRMLLAAIAPP